MVISSLCTAARFGRRPREGALQTQTGTLSRAFGRNMYKVPLRPFGRYACKAAKIVEIRCCRFFFLQHSHVKLSVDKKTAHHSRRSIASTLTAPSATLKASWCRRWANTCTCRSTHAGTGSSTPKPSWSCDTQSSSRGSDAVRPAPSDAGSVASSTYHRPRGSSCQAAQQQQGGKGLQCHRWYHQRPGS